MKNGFKFHNHSLDINDLKKIFKSSIPIGIGVIFVWLYDRIDILMVQRMIDLSSVASYAVAYSLYKIPQIISGAILIPTYTDYSRRFSRTHYLKFDDIIKLGVLLLIISILFIIIFLYSSDSLIMILYGTKYKTSTQYLKILAFAIPGIYFNNLTGVISNSIRKEKIPLLSTGIGVLICITMNAILIPVIGIWSAVYTTIAVEYVVFLVQLAFLLKYYFNKKINFI
jgi:O-antigen/teichoic acid export membrane protein